MWRISLGLLTLFFLLALPLSAEEPADVIFLGGAIVTSDQLRPEVEALAIRGDRILALGDLEDIVFWKGPKTELVHLDGRALLPGFVGAHTHPVFRELTRHAVDVGPTLHGSLDSILGTLREAAAKGPVLAFGYDQSLIEGEPELNFENLDAISSDVPIVVVNLSCHIGYANKAAFKLAGINKSTPDPVGGNFERDQNGELTGVANEIPGLSVLLAAFSDAPPDFEALTRATLVQYASKGFTTITVTGLGMPFPTPEAHIRNLKQAALSEGAPVRVQGYVNSDMLDQIPGMVGGDDRFKVLGMKLWADGSVQGYTAALAENYSNRDSKGVANYTQEALNEILGRAHRKGLQIAVHANGDRAIEMSLTALEKAQKDFPREDARHRVEHFTVANRTLLKRAKEAGVTPTFLDQHVYVWGKVFLDRFLGHHRAHTLDPAGTAERLGMHFSFHDDAPTGEPDPLLMIQIAVTREMREGGILNESERIPIDRAIRALTFDPAWQSFCEDTRGSLAVGKYADLVILSGNPRKVDASKIKDLKVLETWVGGKPVWPTGTAAP
jgi:predicted amidohydrolase YtcJ